MDNITHSLAGVAFAEVALRDAAPRADRRLFIAAGVIASNAPDLDLIFTGITPAPLGYLLHHRGHTHTIPGLIALTAIVALGCWLVPACRRLDAAGRLRLFAVVAVTLGAHVLLDALNNYGVHPFHPLDRRWYYGDAVFIFEPWLAALLAVAGAFNARSLPARLAIAVPPGVLTGTLAYFGIIKAGSVGVLAAGAVAIVTIARRMNARTRAASALIAGAAVCVLFFSSSRVARATALAAFDEPNTEILDAVMTPHPASPLCWSATLIGLRSPSDGAGRTFVMRRGILSLAPRLQPPTCAFSRFQPETPSTPAPGGHVAWIAEIEQSVEAWRALERRDCRVRAWLQFARTPVRRGEAVFDLRFDSPRGNFTGMRLDPGDTGCPPNLTSWGMPRADLFEDQ